MGATSRADQAFEQLESLIMELSSQDVDRLPPETELSQKFGVSRATIREALGRLEAAGRVQRRRGRGTVLMPLVRPALRYPANIIGSFADFLKESGVDHRLLEFSVTHMELEDDIVRMFDEGSPSNSGFRSVRCYALGDVPAALLYHLLPATIQGQPLCVEKLRGDIVPFLESVHQVQIDSVTSAITAEEASDDVARQLGLKQGSAVLVMYTRVIDSKGATLALGALAFNPAVVTLGVEALEHVTAGGQLQFPTGWLQRNIATRSPARREENETTY
ncbi:GntR family transcriptional regulator [Pseudarthrobacter sp. NamE2]|uniref:GntR family transcriptional regulator n=1 Tax=Pseudarthrobacter sp. NamE2 TaxID=2576838 RepID=UPI0010FD9BF2|nr:GntR family transcriptional regulator [Pseudarthrobacter sp. NamE2]TLM81980.1 GntR family transcriptional regulator [Pseudarthrobacter sp. NamE2]